MSDWLQAPGGWLRSRAAGCDPLEPTERPLLSPTFDDAPPRAQAAFAELLVMLAGAVRVGMSALQVPPDLSFSLPEVPVPTESITVV